MKKRIITLFCCGLLAGVSAVAGISQERLAMLQKESAMEAAVRVLFALSQGDSVEVREAMCQYNVEKQIRRLRGCQFVMFKQKRHRRNWADTVIRFKIKFPEDGNNPRQLLHRRICLRNDNPQHIWIVDGGL